jgi:hypothetical protein
LTSASTTLASCSTVWPKGTCSPIMPCSKSMISLCFCTRPYVSSLHEGVWRWLHFLHSIINDCRCCLLRPGTTLMS